MTFSTQYMTFSKEPLNTWRFSTQYATISHPIRDVFQANTRLFNDQYVTFPTQYVTLSHPKSDVHPLYTWHCPTYYIMLTHQSQLIHSADPLINTLTHQINDTDPPNKIRRPTEYTTLTHLINDSDPPKTWSGSIFFMCFPWFYFVVS